MTDYIVGRNLNVVGASSRSRRPLPWNKTAVVKSTRSRGRDLAAIVAFSAIGLAASLLFMLAVPGGLSAFIAQMF